MRAATRNPAKRPFEDADVGLLDVDLKGFPRVVILFDADRLQASARVQPGDRQVDVDQDALLGAITLAPEECIEAEAWKIDTSVAQRGWGPATYDAALALAGSVMPARGPVSQSAKQIWYTYFDERPDVFATPLDAYEWAPIWCRFHDDTRLDHVYSFATRSPAWIERAEQRAQEVLTALEQQRGIEPRQVSAALDRAAYDMFSERYRTRMPASIARNPLEPGTLPSKGARQLNEVFEATERRLLDDGVPAKQAATRAAQIAWSEVKRYYYKRGDRWIRRKRPLTPAQKRARAKSRGGLPKSRKSR